VSNGYLACASSPTDVPHLVVTRRTALGVVGAGLASLALSGCVDTVRQLVPSTPEPKSGGTLRTSQVGDLANIDGHYGTSFVTNTVWPAYDRLTAYDDKLQPQPMLAESWEVSHDAKQIVLHVRKGVQFHTGRELTSDDLKYNLLRVRDPKLSAVAGVLATQSAWWTDIATPDKYTAILTSDKPRPGVFDFFQAFNILDRDTMETAEAKTKVNGTGPFRFVEWASGDHVTLEKNKNYWRTGRPYVDSIVVSILADPQSQVTQLEAGAIDVAASPSLNDVVRLQQDRNFVVVLNYQLGQFFYITANTSIPPFDNKVVRQAMNYSVDRKRFTDTVLHKLVGDPINLPYPPQSPAYEPAKNATYTFDLDKAKALLESAGATNLEFDITYNTGGFGREFASLAQIVQSDLDKIGVKASLKPLDSPTFNAAGLQLTYKGLRIAAGSGAANNDGSSMLQGNAFNYGAFNFAGLKNAQWAQLVEAATTEPDLGTRKALYSQINDLMLDLSATIPVSYYPSVVVTRARVHGLRVAQGSTYSYADTWTD
jgi:peptide/nickel transport system substrate-binding protein